MTIKLDDDTQITVEAQRPEAADDCVEIMIDRPGGGALWLTLSIADAITLRDEVSEEIRQLTEDQHA